MNIMYDNFMKKVIKFSVIIYARLSKEEEGKSSEEKSRSIENQIKICQEFIEAEIQEYPNITYEIVGKLYDDGITGTTFNRNGWNKSIQMLENGEANMIVTKDLSRFGREHVNADNYLEKWFPERNIRYVAVLDGVDTYVPESTNNDIAPIKNWMNEMYAKNTSKSIKRTFKILMEQGKWIGGEPPLGYQIDPNNHHRFIIEPKGAAVVKRIFELAKTEKSLADIANVLTKEKVPIPTVIKGNNRKLNQDVLELWDGVTVRIIIQNEMYLGNMVQGKTKRLSHKSKKVIRIPKEDWIRVENTHEPLVDKDTFETAQLLIKVGNNTTESSYDYLLKNLLVCNECGHSISVQHYKDREKNYTLCCYYRKYGTLKNVCTAHRFVYEDLEQLVLDNIREECKKFVDATDFAEKLRSERNSKQVKEDIKIQIEKCKREISKLNQHIDIIYNDKLEGKIDEEQYIRTTESKKKALEYEKSNLKRLEEDLYSISKNKLQEPDYAKIVKEFLSLKKPTKVMIAKIIDKIIVSEDGTIDIHYKVQNPYKDNES